MSRARSVRAWGPSTGPTACALAGWRCSLWGWRKGVAWGGAFHHCEGRLGSGAVPPPTARPLGGLLGSATPMEVEGELPDMNAEEMAKEGFYLVKSVLRHRYRQGWRFLTLWEGFGVEEATWEPFSAFVLPEGRLNSVLVDYLSQNNLGELLRVPETLASKTKARD